MLITYIKNVLERHKIINDSSDLEELLNVISSSIGSLSNPLNLSNTFKTLKKRNIAPETVSLYLEYFKDAFLIDSEVRYNVKGKKYISTPLKYYFVDVGLRNARLNFLCRINDSFKKFVVIKDNIEPWQDDKGILYIGIEQFLLEEDWLR